VEVDLAPQLLGTLLERLQVLNLGHLGRKEKSVISGCRDPSRDSGRH
jgi:hypothetical protein